LGWALCLPGALNGLALRWQYGFGQSSPSPVLILVYGLPDVVR